MDAVSESGKNPVGKHHVYSLSVENGWAGAERDGTAEPVSQGQLLKRERDREIFIFPVQLTTDRIGNHTRLIHTLLKVMAIHD